MIIKTEDFELEIYTGTDVYFASKKLGQNFKKWDDLEENEKLRLEIIQKKVKRLILESKEILSSKETADNIIRDRRSGIERRQFSYNGHIPERRSTKEKRSGRDRRRELRTSRY
jgi:hypothetical protein